MKTLVWTWMMIGGLALGSGGDALAQAKASSSPRKTTKKAAPARLSPLGALKQKYRKNQISSRQMWDSLHDMASAKKGLTPAEQVEIFQLQGTLLLNAGYPLTGAMFLADALKESPDPLNKSHRKTWELMLRTAKARPIQFVLEDLAQDLDLKNTLPWAFGNNWNYYRANALAKVGKDNEALPYYRTIKLGDRYFLPAQFQIGMIELNQGNNDKAEAAWKTILNQSALNVAPISFNEKLEMKNYAHMALARFYYQQGNFMPAVREYRAVTRTSPSFYDALFEQSWALFMSGNVPHSLGTLHGTLSPFFKDRFNPEAKVLESINYYWICRYEESRNSLADFAKDYSEGVEGLADFLNRRKLAPEAAYQLFEDLISGVTSESLGIPRSVLVTAAERDTMLMARDQYATVLEERSRMADNGIFGSKNALGLPIARLDRKVVALKHDIGVNFLNELKAMKEHYDDLYSQSQFIYLELLMSEKEQLLGRELHKDSKITNVNTQKRLRDWGREMQSWDGGKDEYWWDEIGYHIVGVTSNCKS